MKPRPAVSPSLSVTTTLKLKIPAVEGVPAILPLELREIPFGRLPEPNEN